MDRPLVVFIPISSTLWQTIHFSGVLPINGVWQAKQSVASSAWALMGLPGLTITTDMLGNTPVGIQLVAGRYHENTLLLAGEAIEQGGISPRAVDPVR